MLSLLVTDILLTNEATSDRCMTRSSTKGLFTPFKNPKRECRSSRKLFKTLSLDKSSSPEFGLFSNLEEHSEEEVVETMVETMEEYMCKTRGDYESGVTRPKIDDKDHFELKDQFLKELRDNTFSDSDHEDANEHIEKVLEIVDLFHYCPPARTTKKMEEINKFQQEPNETLYQAWERFKELLMKCPEQYLTKMQEVILFYNGLKVPTRQILDAKRAIPTKTTADAKVAIQEMAKYSQKWHNGTSRIRSTETSDGLSAIQAQLNNLGREIKKVNEKVYDAQVGCELCKGPHYTKDCPLKEEGKIFEEANYTQFGVPFQQGGKRISKKRTKTKPKRQNRARERKEREEKSKSEPKVKKSKSTPGYGIGKSMEKRTRNPIMIKWADPKRISDKRRKNQAKTDKIEHGIEKREKTKSNRSQSQQQSKSEPTLKNT
ncbi:reverse transcriptase domain-containing protein [Tanacetum coccineum]